MRPYYLALLAEAYRTAGKPDEGLSMLTAAFEMAHKTGGRECEAELYRLKGELRLQSNAQGLESSVQKEAEGCFLKAIDIARLQQAKSLELRAMMSLSRLWKKLDKKKEARQMLTEIYRWFVEGFDTVDLLEARALWTEMS